MGTLVRAIAAGFYNGQRVRPGKEFILADGIKPGKWLEVVQENVAAASKKQEEAEAKAAADAKKKAEAAAVKQANDKNRNINQPKPADDLA
jgi:hypothetical protein